MAQFPTCAPATTSVRPTRLMSSYRPMMDAVFGSRKCDGGWCPFGGTGHFKELKLATFNARADTVDTKPFFREPFKSRRCLMPVSGYYEWEDTPQGKQPHYFTARDGSTVLTIAALWDQSTDCADPRRSRWLLHHDHHRGERLRRGSCMIGCRYC